MVNITWGGVVAGISVVWWRVKVFWNFWSPVIEQIVKEIEEKAKDGVIDKTDKKSIALKAIDLIAQKKNKKVGWLEKVIISKLIDKYAERLIPGDIQIPKIIEDASK